MTTTQLPIARLLFQMITIKIIITILHLQGQKSMALLSFAIEWELTILKRIFFKLSMFPIASNGDSSMTTILFAGYKMIPMSKINKAL